MPTPSTAERALWGKLSAERRRVRRLESELGHQTKLILRLSQDRSLLRRELDSWHQWGLWMADRITFLETRIEGAQD